MHTQNLKIDLGSQLETWFRISPAQEQLLWPPTLNSNYPSLLWKESKGFHPICWNYFPSASLEHLSFPFSAAEASTLLPAVKVARLALVLFKPHPSRQPQWYLQPTNRRENASCQIHSCWGHGKGQLSRSILVHIMGSPTFCSFALWFWSNLGRMPLPIVFSCWCPWDHHMSSLPTWFSSASHKLAGRAPEAPVMVRGPGFIPSPSP